jgi:capsular exopolysaccharide synthesis family protein
MSYIYEALLRAERERQPSPSALDEQKAPAPLPPIEESLPSPPQEFYLASESVPEHEWVPYLPSFPTLAKHGRGLEQFRSLRSHIFQARNEIPLKTILVSSGMPSEGKSFVAANLAMSLARNSGNRILLIDGDLRRPSLNLMLGAPNDIGLSDYLAGNADLQAIMQRSAGENANGGEEASAMANLMFIPTGTLHENASELITNRRIKELIANVSASFDWIIIDSPPALVFADAVDLSRAADAVLMVVRGSQTTYQVAQRAKTSFANARILGVVLNDIKNPPRRGSYYDYYYYGKKRTPVEATEQEAE